MTGLRARLTAALVLLSVLTLAITAVSLLAPLDRQLREDALTSLEQTATTAKPGFEDLPAAAFHAGSPALDRATEDLSRRTRAEIIVVDSQGRVLSATSLDPGERFADATAAIRSGRTISGTAGTTEEEDEDEAQVAVPFKVDGRPLALAVRKSLDDISSTQEVVRSALLVAALLALAVAVVAGVILASRLVRRLTALRDTALRVAELGPVAEVQPDTTRDEIGDLTRAFATMQQRLREQEQARRTFIATASHELRTPLASLRLMLHGARDELQAPQPDVTDAREQVDLALAQSERLGKLAAELLDLSRLDAGLPLRSELVELGEVARSVIAEFDPRAADAGIDLRAAAPVWAVADPGSVAQILRILLDNALRHAPAGSHIGIDVDVADGGPSMAVSDSGSGIAAADAERIFRRFERGDGADGGFGLGLAIGREQARRMDGDLALDPAGDGARFVLRLPAAPAGAA